MRRACVAVLLLVCALAATAAHAQVADLVVNQSDAPDPGPAGGVFTYTVRVDNNGPNDALNVSLTDTLPAGAAFVGVGTTQGSCVQSSGTVTCSLGGIAFLANATVTIQVVLPTPGVYTNAASASAATSDPNGTNNTSITEDTTAQNAADLTLTAVDAPDPVSAGQPYTYTLGATNHGPASLTASDTATIAFSVPAGACVTALPSGAGWTCTPPTGYPLCTGSISCTRPGPLASGASAPNLTVAAVANTHGSVTASFQASSTLADGNPADNTAVATTTVNGGSSDVSISISAAPATVAVGSNVTYTLTPRFNGGEPPGGLAPNLITVTDTLDSTLAFVSATGTGWSCSFGAPTVTCTRPGPYPGGNFTNMPTIAIVATATAVGSLSSTATIAAPETDPVPANNTASTTTSASNDADLQLTKTSSLAPVVPNQDFNYTLTVRNNGPVAATAANTITVTDNLPAELILRAAPTGTGWTCLPNAGFPISGPVSVTCTRPGPLAVASNAPNINVPVRASIAASISNTACAALSGSGPSDSAAGNNCGTSSLSSTVAQADLRVLSKTASPNPVFAGQDLTYVITVTNQGPDAATNVTVTDTLANLVTTGGFQSATPSQGSCTPGTVTNGPSVNLSCNLGTLNNGDTATVTVVVRPTIATTGNRANTASITSSDVGDPDRTNNSASVTSTVTAVADVAVSKTASPNPVRAGTPLTYVLTARNNGPSTAQTVSAADTLPGNAAFVQLSAVTGGGSCTTPAAGASGGTLTCSWASIASGAQQTATYVVRPLTSAGGGTVSNSASIATTTTEFNAANNTASVTTPVTTALLDILVNKIDSVDPVAIGQGTTYTVTITNAGPSFGTNVVMVDTFPSGSPTATFSYQGNLTLNPPGIGACTEPALNATSGTLTCTLPGLASGQSAVVTYDMRAESIAAGISGTTFNTATVSVTEPETQLTNNTATNATTSRRTADLAIAKSAPAAATPGTTFDYTLVVTNNGPNSSVDATLTDVLPSGVSFVSASPGCANASGTITCALGTLANGNSATFTVTVRVSSPYSGANPLVNTATVATANEVDPNGANNTSSGTTTVGAPSTDVSIVKTGPASVVPGGALTYTLAIANAGPSSADGATFLDTLPAGLGGVSAACGSASGGAVCGPVAANAAGVSGTIPTLPAGGSLVITVNATAPANAAGSLVNQSSVAPPGGATDGNPGNNASSVTTTIAPVDLTIVKSHAGTFIAGQVGAVYTLLVSNVGSAPSSGTVGVVDVLPAGMSATGMSGSGWSCVLATLACTRSDVLPPSASYPAIAVTVDIDAAATGTLVNAASVSGGNDSNAANNTASDPAAIGPGADLTISKSHSGALVRGQSGAQYTLVVTNAGVGPGSGLVTVADLLPAGLTAHAIAGTGWACDLATVACTRSDPLPAGGSYPAIVVTVDVASNAPGTLVNQATVTLAGDVDSANNQAVDSAPVSQASQAEPVPTLDGLALVTLIGLLWVASAWASRRRRDARQRR